MAGAGECGRVPSGSIKCGGISWLAEELLAPQEGLCCVNLVSWLVSTVFILQCAIGLYCVPSVPRIRVQKCVLFVCCTWHSKGLIPVSFSCHFKCTIN